VKQPYSFSLMKLIFLCLGLVALLAGCHSDPYGPNSVNRVNESGSGGLSDGRSGNPGYRPAGSLDSPWRH
jgi:hypothetical protein